MERGNQTPFAALVPELSCSDFVVSRAFYVDVLGFNIRYERPEHQFAYLQLGSAQIMIEQVNGNWETGPMEQPFGRGINFQIEIDDAKTLSSQILSSGYCLFRKLTTSWHRENDIEHGQDEFLILDPDGYLLRFATSIGTRPWNPNQQESSDSHTR